MWQEVLSHKAAVSPQEKMAAKVVGFSLVLKGIVLDLKVFDTSRYLWQIMGEMVS